MDFSIVNVIEDKQRIKESKYQRSAWVQGRMECQNAEILGL
jgi:hypothetical protein